MLLQKQQIQKEYKTRQVYINMKKIVMIVLLVVFLSILSFSILKFSLTGEAVAIKEYSYTRAVCNSSNFCQDYEIYCRNGNIEKQIPITGSFIQHSEEWKDPRNESISCE